MLLKVKKLWETYRDLEKTLSSFTILLYEKKSPKELIDLNIFN